MTRPPAVKQSNAKWLKIVGGILATVGVLDIGSPIDALFWSDYWVSLWLPELLQFLALAAGVAMLGKGVSMDRQLKRYPKYLAVLGIGRPSGWRNCPGLWAFRLGGRRRTSRA